MQAIKQLLKEQLSHVESDDVGITTGFDVLDSKIGKFRKQELNVVASRVGFGKTSFILNSVLENIKNNNNVLYFSLDLTNIQLLKKIISMTTKIPLSNLQNATDFLLKEIDKLDSSIDNLFIDDSKYLSIDYIIKTSKKMLRDNNIKMIVIDYYQLIENHDNLNIARELKKLAIELDLPIVLLSQLDKEIETRTNKTPYIRDIQNSDIEVEANTIIFIYIPNFYEEEQELIKEANARLKNEESNNCYIEVQEVSANIIIAKNIYGHSTLDFLFQRKIGKYIYFNRSNSIIIPNKKEIRLEIGKILDKCKATFRYSVGLSSEILEDISILEVDEPNINNIPKDIPFYTTLKTRTEIA